MSNTKDFLRQALNEGVICLVHWNVDDGARSTGLSYSSGNVKITMSIAPAVNDTGVGIVWIEVRETPDDVSALNPAIVNFYGYVMDKDFFLKYGKTFEDKESAMAYLKRWKEEIEGVYKNHAANIANDLK